MNAYILVSLIVVYLYGFGDRSVSYMHHVYDPGNSADLGWLNPYVHCPYTFRNEYQDYSIKKMLQVQADGFCAEDHVIMYVIYGGSDIDFPRWKNSEFC